MNKSVMFEGTVRLDLSDGIEFSSFTVDGLDAAVSSLFPEDSRFQRKDSPRRVRVTIEVVEE